VGARGRKAGAANRKQGGNAALNAATFPRSVAWRVDQDYLGQLSSSDKAWLAGFNDRYYGADFRGPSDSEWSTDERREVYRNKNRANRDLMTCALPAEDVDLPQPSVELEELSVDDLDYLDASGYKAARAAYRDDPSPANRVRLNQFRRR
jgi:hypothetical protein